MGGQGGQYFMQPQFQNVPERGLSLGKATWLCMADETDPCWWAVAKLWMLAKRVSGPKLARGPVRPCAGLPRGPAVHQPSMLLAESP